jgi:hypothetical protein
MLREIPTPKKTMKLKTALKAGSRPGDDCPTWGCGMNHNQILASSTPPRPTKLKTAPKANGRCPELLCGRTNLNQTLSPRR